MNLSNNAGLTSTELTKINGGDGSSVPAIVIPKLRLTRKGNNITITDSSTDDDE